MVRKMAMVHKWVGSICKIIKFSHYRYRFAKVEKKSIFPTLLIILYRPRTS